MPNRPTKTCKTGEVVSLRYAQNHYEGARAIDNNRVRQAVEPLTGLKLSVARRAADMRVFHFGHMREVDRGTIGQYTLHIQCPWRIDGPKGIVTGRFDLWQHISGKTMPDEWEPSIDDNIQDMRLRNLFGGYDTETGSHVNSTEWLVVEHVQTSNVGDLEIRLSGGYRLVVFPGGSTGEEWRIFEPDKDSPHFVVEGNGVYFI